MSRIEHSAIFARDPGALADFYVATFGLATARSNLDASPPGVFLADDRGAALEIVGRPPGADNVNQRYICHVAFTVAADRFDALRDELTGRGLVFESETAIDRPEFRTAFFRDPEGNRTQIVWRSEPLTP